MKNSINALDIFMSDFGGTKILAFLASTRHLNVVSFELVVKVSKRLETNPYCLVACIKLNGGKVSDEK
jgi:hypothetical protein